MKGREEEERREKSSYGQEEQKLSRQPTQLDALAASPVFGNELFGKNKFHEEIAGDEDYEEDALNLSNGSGVFNFDFEGRVATSATPDDSSFASTLSSSRGGPVDETRLPFSPAFGAADALSPASQRRTVSQILQVEAVKAAAAAPTRRPAFLGNLLGNSRW